MSGLMGQNCPRIQPVTHQRTRGELGSYLLFIFHSSDAGVGWDIPPGQIGRGSLDPATKIKICTFTDIRGRKLPNSARNSFT